MKLIIGLGNPGHKYRNNRHNVGHMFVNWAKKESFFRKERFFTKTDRFMNESGRFVKKQMDFFKIKPEDLYVAHDDLDILIGQWKIQLGVGPKIHYGVNSVEESLGTKNFWRIRIGVDSRNPENRIPGEEYVLQDFTKKEIKILEGVFPRVVEDLKSLV